MLTKIFRIGAAEQSIEKVYLVSGRVEPNHLKKLAATWLNVKLEYDASNPQVLRICSGKRWLGDAAQRDVLFGELAAAQRSLLECVHRHGGALAPAAFQLEYDPAVNQLCADRHIIHQTDDIEQRLYCELLRDKLPLLIAALGRALVRDHGVDALQSTRIMDGQTTPALRWPSTSQAHLGRIEADLQTSVGIRTVSSLDLHPTWYDASTPAVEIDCIDGQVWLADARATMLILQALFLRARRMAREGTTERWSSQKVFIRNRARAAADGPAALMEPGRQVASRAWIDLVIDLRRELRLLDARYDEFEPLVLGHVLRALGKPAAMTENDVLRQLLRKSQSAGSSLADLAKRCLLEGSVSPLAAVNRQRFAEAAQSLERWWRTWLQAAVDVPPFFPPRHEATVGKYAADARRARSQEGPPARDRHSQGERSGSRGVRPGTSMDRSRPIQSLNSDSNSTAFARFLSAWNALPPGDASRNERLTLLVSNRRLASRFGFLLSQSDEGARRSAKEHLRGLGKTCKAIELRAIDATADDALQRVFLTARSAGSARIILEIPTADADQRLKALDDSLPSDLIAFRTSRLRVSADSFRQEILLVAAVEGKSHG